MSLTPQVWMPLPYTVPSVYRFLLHRSGCPSPTLCPVCIDSYSTGLDAPPLHCAQCIESYSTGLDAPPLHCAQCEANVGWGSTIVKPGRESVYNTCTSMHVHGPYKHMYVYTHTHAWTDNKTHTCTHKHTCILNYSQVCRQGNGQYHCLVESSLHLTRHHTFNHHEAITTSPSTPPILCFHSKHHCFNTHTHSLSLQDPH